MATTFHAIDKDIYGQEDFLENYSEAMRQGLTVKQKQLLGILDHNSEEYQETIAAHGTVVDIKDMLRTPGLLLSPKCFESILAVAYSINDSELGNLFVDALFVLESDGKISLGSSFDLANKVKFLPFESMRYFLDKVKESKIELLTYFKATIADRSSQYANLVFSYYDSGPILSAMKSYNEKVAKVHGVPGYTSVA